MQTGNYYNLAGLSAVLFELLDSAWGIYMQNNIICVEDLYVEYKSCIAVNHIDLKVHDGEVLGIIGENGAGKTTTIECIAGINKEFKGNIVVLGNDIKNVRKSFYNDISVQLQEASFPEKLKVSEICKLFNSFYKKPIDYNSLLNAFGLEEKTSTYYGNLSGGQKQKLSILVALISNARIIIMDELTTGLDPQARRNTINIIKQYTKGRTILLTTHFMDEAEALCDRVCFMGKGKILKLGKIDELFIECGIKNKVVFSSEDEDIDKYFEKNYYFVEKQGSHISIMCNEDLLISEVENILNLHNVKYSNLQQQGTRLEDLYFKILGKKVDE